jgi:hypothetical protein
MKFIFLAFILSLPFLNAQEPISLFDGKSLEHWEGDPKIWRIEDKAITASIPAGKNLAKNQFLYWKEKVADFDLSLNYRITGGPTANSGIQIRSQKDASGHAAGYQCDLDDGKLWLGRIYDEHGRGLIAERGALTKIAPDGKSHILPFSNPSSLTRFARLNDWNHYLINAVAIVSRSTSMASTSPPSEDYQQNQADLSGLLAVQIHSGVGPAKVQFRDITLTAFDQKKTDSH